jgi:WD40 repeat protein
MAVIAGSGALLLGLVVFVAFSALFSRAREAAVTAGPAVPAKSAPISPVAPPQPATPAASQATIPVAPQPNPAPAFPAQRAPGFGATPTPRFGGQPSDSTAASGTWGTAAADGSSSRPAGNVPATKPRPDEGRAPARSGARENPPDALPKVPNLADLPRAAAAGQSRRPGGTRRAAPGGDDASPADDPDWIPWTASVDAPEPPVEGPPGKPAIPIPTGGHVVFARRPSNFVVVAGRDDRRRTAWGVYDLRTSKLTGKPVYPDNSATPSLFSPDGRYVADRLRVTGKEVYGVWSFVTGEFVREMTLADRSVVWVAFVQPHQLLGVAETPEGLVARIWDVRNGDEVRTCTLFQARSRRGLRDAFILTPGGRYLCCIEGDRLAAYDLTTGRCAGHAQLPAVPRSCVAGDFSPDGTELACLLSFDSMLHLVCCDFASGRITLNHPYDDAGGAWFHGLSLSWVPDKSALLCAGNILLDRETGIEIWQFPADRSNPRRLLSLKRMLAVVDGRGGKTLTCVDLPEKDLLRARESVRGGGKGVDAALPRLVQANAVSARALTLPTGATSWSAAPDTAGPAVVAGRDLMIAKENETLKAALCAAPDRGRVVVQKTARRAVGAGRATDQITFIERYDVKSGQKSKDVPLPLVYEMLDISPSGDHVLVGFQQHGRGCDRLDVMRLQPREHIAGWRPYAGEAQAAHRSRGENVQVATRAVMLDDTHVLTVNGKGKLVVWELPDCKALYVCEDFGYPAAFSALRKYMLGVHHEEIRLFETATGECRGDLPSPRTGTQLRRAAFRPDGTAAAGVVADGKNLALALWDLQTGTLSAEFPLPPGVLQSAYRGAGALEWRGDRHLMLDHQFLIDLKNRAVVWRYHLPAGSVFAVGGPTDKTWFCTARDDGNRGAKFLVGAETPNATARLKTEFTTLEKQLVLGPGMSVQLQVQVAEDLRAKVQALLTEALQARDIRIDPTSRLLFVLSTQQGTTGQEIGVTSSRSPFASRFGRPETVFAQGQMSCLMAIKDANGKERWSHRRQVAMRSSGVARTDQVQAELSQEMQSAFQSMLSSGDFLRDGLPTYIFGDLNEILAGASTLTLRGEGPPPPPPAAAPPLIPAPR